MEFVKKSMRILLRHRDTINKQIINKVQNMSGNQESFYCKKLTGKEVLHKFRRKEEEQLSVYAETLSPLFETNNLTDDRIINIRNAIMNKHSILEQNVDLKILDVCLKLKKFELAKSYYDYIKNKNYPLSNFILMKYLLVLSSGNIPITNTIEKDIINICNKVQKDYEYLPNKVLITCVHALCMTRKWETTFDLIKVNGTIEDADCSVLSHIARAAFKNGKEKIGFKLLEEIGNDIDGDINENIYHAYLNYYLLNKKEKLNDAIKKMFLFWKKHDVLPVTPVVNKFVDVCKESGWEGHHVRISNDGQCSHCQKYLSSMGLQNNYTKLYKAILSKIIIGEDVFQKTSPSELNKFKMFVNKLKPFDIVIDSLNVTYAVQGPIWMDFIVKKFVKEKKKILIIARQHQYNSLKCLFDKDNLFVYFLKDITHDDPFLLYATLSSGNNAMFVSIDQLRQHHHLLKQLNLHKEFIRWQFSHQYTWYFNYITNNYVLVNPILYNPFAQFANGHWHIPYRDSLKTLHKPTETWVCLRQINK